ncbi:hypothetical protein HCH_00095 [Hahella chejuensis KCTC 2396]|uniref:Uncharacterized protein n=1 Tax=Hahella chejuensis (strain KCTC 2396) TaxID=349521 RepID=Q2SQQ8_HAHCH|nr:hypothetical protein [Hahella chejuensis]ABC27016.1 hypothetical protein HCH_00095 [Hahella chejuensis KCTC 2396]
MPLHDLQIAMVEMIHSHTSDAADNMDLNRLDLSAEERTWLHALKASKGFKVTCDVQKWWRKARLQIAAPLTLRLLDRLQLQALVEEYMRATPCRSLYFVPEAMSFKTFICEHTKDPLLHALTMFESALKAIHEYRLSPVSPMEPSSNRCRNFSVTVAPMSQLIEFPAAPEKLLCALMLNQPLPNAEGPHPVLVAPGVRKYWRAATTMEREVLHQCAAPQPLDSLLEKGPHKIRVVERLISERALRLV